MRLGMIVRADHTGLGNQSWEMFRHLQPDVTVTIVPTSGAGSNLPQHLDRYPDSHVHRWDPRPRTIPDSVADLFSDCDVVYSAETFYDPTLPARLDKRGVATVLHANPELWTADETPTELWLPTTWMVDHVRERTPASIPVRVMPLPVPVDRALRIPPDPTVKRIVHPTSTAMADRNGGTTVHKALSVYERPGRNVHLDYVGPRTRWITSARTVTDWWERDAGAWLSVIPRRYGGLCLPALEAMASGVPVVMPDIPPNSNWPIIGLSSHRTAVRTMKGGQIPLYGVNAGELRNRVLEHLDPSVRAEKAAAVTVWADANGPEFVIPRWVEGLTAVIT